MIVYDVVSGDHKRHIGTFSTIMKATAVVSEHSLLKLDIIEREVNWFTWLFWKVMR